ncbi:MAG: tyrosine-type recombinase/integrase [Xanthobacteraceae bacterium]
MGAAETNQENDVTERKPLTDADIKKLPVPEKGYTTTYDSMVRNLGVRVTANGARSFTLNYRVRGSGRQRRYTIGDTDTWGITVARKEARRLKQIIDQGGDPLRDLQDERDAPTVSDLIDRFDAEHITPYLRPSSATNYRTVLNRYVRPHFGQHTKVADVDFEDITALHAKITKAGATYAANRTIAITRKMFALAINWRMRDDNPCRGITRNYEAKRKRYLKPDEMARLIEALAAYPDQQVANIVRLLLMTGARSAEVMGMRWGDVDLGSGVWSKPASTTKQKQDHIVPLSAPARMLLTEIAAKQKKPLGAWVFPSSNNTTGHTLTIERAWVTICRVASLENLRVHDLRHSFASELVSSGASLALIGALLGHSNPTTTARYAHLYDDPMRKAVETVGATITAAGKPAETPVEFPRRGRPRRA